jgi:Cu2+-containing amine oxidase
MRELVVQFIITLANYEYVFAYKLDTAGGITLEVRATGIVSVVNIDPGKASEYGNVVSGGVLAQNHQHIFAARKLTTSSAQMLGTNHKHRYRSSNRRPQQHSHIRRIALRTPK